MAHNQRTFIRKLLPTAHKILLDHGIMLSLAGITGDVLVVGSGHEPYRKLLTNSSSICLTDIVHGEDIDIVADAHDLPFADESFDAIIAIEVFEHLRDPYLAAAEINRVLRPNGVALISVPFMFRVHGDPYDFQRFTADGLRTLFQNHFELKISPIGNRIQVISDLVTTAFKSFVIFRIVNHLLCAPPFRFPSSDCPSGYLVDLRKRS